MLRGGEWDGSEDIDLHLVSQRQQANGQPTARGGLRRTEKGEGDMEAHITRTSFHTSALWETGKGGISRGRGGAE